MEWISLSARMPETDRNVLLLFPGGVMAVGYAAFSGSWAIELGDGYAAGYAMGTPTHWMPLPEPPKEGEKKNELP